MTRGPRLDRPASPRAEALGWLAFLLFVAGVYGLRQALNWSSKGHAFGTVTAINGNTLTISAGTDPAGTTEYTGVTTVVLTSATQYDAGHDGTGTISKSSIKVGSYVIVEGTVSSDGKTMTARNLNIKPGGPVPGR